MGILARRRRSKAKKAKAKASGVVEVTCAEISECKRMCRLVFNLIRRVSVEEVVCVNPDSRYTILPVVKRHTETEQPAVVEVQPIAQEAPSRVQTTLETYVGE